MTKPKSYRTLAFPDNLSFLRELATVPGRDDTVETNLLPLGDAITFRKRTYAWRKALRLELTGDTPSEAQEYLHDRIGPRATSEWLAYLTLSLRPLHTDPCRVVGRIGRPAYGPDILFADLQAAGIEQSLAIIRAAASQAGVSPPSKSPAPSSGAGVSAEELEELARDLRCDPTLLQARAYDLLGDRLPHETIIEILRSEFA